MLQTLTPPFQHFLRVAPEQQSQEINELRAYIDGALKGTLGHGIDDEKANALLKKNKNIIASSAPGSGKSLCLLYKLFTLIKKEKVDPNKILVLSFNRSIANQLKARAHGQFGLDNMNTFFTFHSLSYRIINPRQRILCDQKNKHQYLSLYMKKIVRGYLDDIGFKYSYAQLKRLTVLTVQFLGKINKSSMSEGEIKERIGTLVSYKAEALTRIGLILRERYEIKKRKDNMIDFDDVVRDATKLIHATEGECYIEMSHCIGTRVKGIRYLLVDEWQDVSEPFYNLIKSIQRYSPDLRLFVVGDMNQACNMFMGADVKYFDRFLDLFEDSAICHLSMNYRSQKAIVRHANSFMRSVTPMHHLSRNDSGSVVKIGVDKNRMSVLAECTKIINAHHRKDITILTRTNKIFGEDIKDFLDDLKKQLFENAELANIRMSTIHAYKGSECDIAILLKTKGHFPLLHRDRDYFRLFSSEADIIEEEGHLLYVALTRPREQLFIINHGLS